MRERESVFYDSIQMHQEVNQTNLLVNHHQDACLAKTKEVLIKLPGSSLIRFGGFRRKSVLSSGLMRCGEVGRLPATNNN